MSQSVNFHKHADTAWEWVKEMEQEMQIPTEKAARIIRVVLHATRDHVPLNESFHLLAQLPLVWKGIYVDGWKPAQTFQRLDGWKGYLNAIRSADKNLAGYDFGNDIQAKKIILSVWRLLSAHISTNELTHICNTMPNEIKNDIDDSDTKTNRKDLIKINC